MRILNFWKINDPFQKGMSDMLMDETKVPDEIKNYRLKAKDKFTRTSGLPIKGLKDITNQNYKSVQKDFLALRIC